MQKNCSCEVDYVGAGTVEFIYDLDHSCLYFMGDEHRLQVEHPVTGTGFRAGHRGAQLSIAAGESIQDMSWKSEGYAIEARINAEQVVLDGHQFHCHPAPGLVTGLEFPVDSW